MSEFAVNGMKRCEGCGKFFVPTHGLQKYCTECNEDTHGRVTRSKEYYDRVEKAVGNRNYMYDKWNRIIERSCLRCGKVFKAVPGSAKVYCSQECVEAAKKREIEKFYDTVKCMQCGRLLKEVGIRPKPGGYNTFCSEECHEKHKWETARKRGRIKICKQCGKEFIGRDTSVYCSIECRKATVKKKEN